MNPRSIFGLAVIAACAFAVLPGIALGQQKSLKEQLVGTWTLVSITEVFQDGRKENPFGPDVKGAFSVDPGGKFISTIIGADLPQAARKPGESSRLVVVNFGTYAVDEAAKTVTYTNERSTNPALDGLARKASVTVNGDELVQDSAPITSPRGTLTPHSVWKRAK
jgi:hypothetical protein